MHIVEDSFSVLRDSNTFSCRFNSICMRDGKLGEEGRRNMITGYNTCMKFDESGYCDDARFDWRNESVVMMSLMRQSLKVIKLQDTGDKMKL